VPGSGPLSRRAAAVVIGVAVLAEWVVELVNVAGHLELEQQGIVARTPAGLAGIAVAPFVHVSLWHLASNTVPLLVFGWIALVGNGARFAVTTLVAAVASGLGVWLFAPAGTVTVGSSGVLFGWVGYVLVRGHLEPRHRIAGPPLAIVLAGVLLSLLPLHTGISWQGHVCGLLGGAVAAIALAERPRAVR
jgi:membrane associated rhomboid family serine protease